MSLTKRILIGVGIVALDIVVVFIPLAAIVFLYIVVAKPREFKTWIDKLYSDKPGNTAAGDQEQQPQ